MLFSCTVAYRLNGRPFCQNWKGTSIKHYCTIHPDTTWNAFSGLCKFALVQNRAFPGNRVSSNVPTTQHWKDILPVGYLHFSSGTDVFILLSHHQLFLLFPNPNCISLSYLPSRFLRYHFPSLFIRSDFQDIFARCDFQIPFKIMKRLPSSTWHNIHLQIRADARALQSEPSKCCALGFCNVLWCRCGICECC